MIEITKEQAELLKGKQYDDISYFNPIENEDGQWFISVEEIANCTNKEFIWIKDLKDNERN